MLKAVFISEITKAGTRFEIQKFLQAGNDDFQRATVILRASGLLPDVDALLFDPVFQLILGVFCPGEG